MLTDFENLDQNEKNILYQEHQKAQYLYSKILKMYENGLIKKHHKIEHRNFD